MFGLIERIEQWFTKYETRRVLAKVNDCIQESVDNFLPEETDVKFTVIIGLDYGLDYDDVRAIGEELMEKPVGVGGFDIEFIDVYDASSLRNGKALRFNFRAKTPVTSA